MDQRHFASLFRDARRQYDAGVNIIETITRHHPHLRGQAIAISYSLQSGSYTERSCLQAEVDYRKEVHEILRHYSESLNLRTFADFGAGEGTLWIDYVAEPEKIVFLDISYNRLRWCRRNLDSTLRARTKLYVKATLQNPPLSTAAVDSVITAHAIEPNSSADAETIIGNVARVATKAAILFEPDYTTAPANMRKHMERHGYARNIFPALERLPGWRVLDKFLMKSCRNPNNRPTCIVLERIHEIPRSHCLFRSPVDESPLTAHENCYIDSIGCFAFPVIGSILCCSADDATFIGSEIP